MMHIWAVSQSAGTQYRPIASTHLRLVPLRWNKMEKWPRGSSSWMKNETLNSPFSCTRGAGERGSTCNSVIQSCWQKKLFIKGDLVCVCVCDSFSLSLLSEQLYLATSQSQDLLSHLKKRMQLAWRNNLRLILSSLHSDLWWCLCEPQRE